MDTTSPATVTFPSSGESLTGKLYPARYTKGPAPAVVIVGPMTYQKEQAPTEYAIGLSEMGYQALVFDSRYRGESSGEPRNYENPSHKVEDILAALDFLESRDDVDKDRLALVGICMGSPNVVVAASQDPRVKALATAAGQYRDQSADETWLGSAEAIQDRLVRGQKALEKYQQSGEVDYVPAIDRQRMDVGMPGALVWGWYQAWADDGRWDNQYAVMSDEAMFSFESLSAAQKLQSPWLMIHSDQSALPETAKKHFEAAPSDDKLLLWEGATHHFQYYEDPATIRRACFNILTWFSQHGL